MSDRDERVWLTHPDIPGSSFPCPVEAVDHWRTVLGWVDGEPPEPVNPVTAEQPKPAAPAAVEPTPAKASKKAASTEGSD